MEGTRSKVAMSLQIGTMGVIENLATEDYVNNKCVQIKNDGDDAVMLEVCLAAMPEGTWVETRFEVGWNPEIVKAIKHNASAASYNLKYGY